MCLGLILFLLADSQVDSLSASHPVTKPSSQLASQPASQSTSQSGIKASQSARWLGGQASQQASLAASSQLVWPASQPYSQPTNHYDDQTCSQLVYLPGYRNLAWSQQDFLQPSFCRKRNLWSLCFDGKTKMEFLFIASMEKKKSEGKSISHPSSFPILPFSSMNAVKTSTIQFPPKKQRLHKLRFLQKLGCQKPCWDQATLL